MTKIVELSDVMDESYQHLMKVQRICVEETGRVQPIAMLISISDGSEMYTDMPVGSICKMIKPLVDWSLDRPESALEELLIGISSELPMTVDSVASAMITFKDVAKVHPESYDQGMYEILLMTLEEHDKTWQDIMGYGLQRLAKHSNAMGALVSMNLPFEYEDENGELSGPTEQLSFYSESWTSSSMDLIEYSIEDEVLETGEVTPVDRHQLINFFTPIFQGKAQHLD